MRVLDIGPDDFNPGVLALFPHRESWRREEWIVEGAERDGDETVELAFDLVVHVRSALGAEMKGYAIAAVRNIDPALRPALDRHLFRRPTGLHREGASRALLAIEAMADRDPHGLSGDDGAKLTATAGGDVRGHARARSICRFSSAMPAARMSCPSGTLTSGSRSQRGLSFTS